MRKLFFLTLMVIGFTVKAQYYYGCKDTLAPPDTYFQCAQYGGGSDYNPVCGCDNITYRNACAAEHWGGLYYQAWTDNTVCGNFHIDLNPTAVSYNPVAFYAYIKNINNTNIPITLYIYDDFGKNVYTWYDNTSINGIYPSLGQPLQIPAQDFPYGIYILVVTVNGENQSIKFAKVTDNLK